MATSLENRFWPKVDKSAGLGPQGECWEWRAKIQNKGYGRYWHEGRYVLPHRLSDELAYGPIPSGLYICHRCDNRKCLNPAHLFVGTPDDNVRDMIAKGRARFEGGKTGREYCKRGHHMSGDNLYLSKGKRECRACSLFRSHQRTLK